LTFGFFLISGGSALLENGIDAGDAVLVSIEVFLDRGVVRVLRVRHVFQLLLLLFDCIIQLKHLGVNFFLPVLQLVYIVLLFFK